ncbi:MAG TPA: murein biosynthesis integral membrane protein MurJ [Verrucomicrobiae bacterium]|nr:murein biosynthesis integral membrane protein MurJ [Verrucomicrobiae bacterium]
MGIFKRVGSLFQSGPVGIKQASILLVLTAVLSNALGLLRNVVFYWLIDKGELSIYYASFRIPDLLFNVLIFGAIGSAFVPILSRTLAKHKEEDARVFADQTFTWLTVIFVALAAVFAIFMEPLMRLVVHGFDPERFNATVHLSRILMLQSVFFAWSFICGGYLNSFRRFGSPAFAPLMYNLAIIASTFVAAKTGIEAIAYGVIVGAILHFGIQFIEMRRTGYMPRWNLQRSPEIRELARLMVPRSISQGMSQIVLIVFTALASGLAASSIAILAGMNDLQTTPTVILANSLAVALFPTLAARVATEDWNDVNRLIQRSFRTLLFYLIPGLILAFVLRAQIVRLYMSMGHTSWDETNLAIATFIGFLIGIIPAAFVVMLSRVFYALRDTKTPMFLSIIAGGAGIAWAFVSITVYNGTVASLAVAGSVVSIVQCLLYLIALKQHKTVQLGLISLIPQIARYTLLGLASGLATWSTLQIVDWAYVTMGILGTQYIAGLFLQFAIAGTVGLLVILGYSKLVLPEELSWLKNKRFTTNQ